MGSAVLTLMVFFGVILIARSILFGIIPRLMQNKDKKKEASPREKNIDDKEQD